MFFNENIDPYVRNKLFFLEVLDRISQDSQVARTDVYEAFIRQIFQSGNMDKELEGELIKIFGKKGAYILKAGSVDEIGEVLKI